MKINEVIALVIVSFILGYGFHYIVADDARIERESGVQVAVK